ncbi:hypothetical protein [Pseudonocardia sp. ICBG1293]|uniref:hypothetical protein n=1 Tax=Pseudonocardia sp. ICBG1293 TaxID=2844382 RepID=UPI001CCE0A28|nr:hypothetical protein [Pseudonocardia sp. ICBG1293]
MNQFRKIGGLAAAALGGLSYTWCAGAEHVAQNRPIPVFSALPLGLLVWLAICFLLASEKKKLIAWWILVSGGMCTAGGVGILLTGLSEDGVTPFIAVLLFAHLLIMLRNVRRLESRLL